jgi:hypothetical protein
LVRIFANLTLSFSGLVIRPGCGSGGGALGLALGGVWYGAVELLVLPGPGRPLLLKLRPPLPEREGPLLVRSGIFNFKNLYFRFLHLQTTNSLHEPKNEKSRNNPATFLNFYFNHYQNFDTTTLNLLSLEWL